MKYVEKTTVIEKDSKGNIVKETTTVVEKDCMSSPYVNPNPLFTPYWSDMNAFRVTCGSASVNGISNTIPWN